ncbi:hypothetical protein RGE_36970 [Rubrivivax gelatinosus IL144]|uniref:Uncharacterized protein n=1 Tax=Rubrivivax gelatinosus (strain NBRC 100245 / IL144) TaxID=983917 RepID=I0HVJ9_RUBGI|nr:hypothetical protein RGE_36970 [Rubrivivax gelatinosus IL144]
MSCLISLATLIAYILAAVMMLAGLALGVLAIGACVVGISDRIERPARRTRRQLMEANGYYRGLRYVDLPEPLRRAASISGGSSGRTRYTWDAPEDPMYLECDAQGVIVDHMPPRAPPDLLRHFFETQPLDGWTLERIEHAIGRPTDSIDCDRGQWIYWWRLPDKARIELSWIDASWRAELFDGVHRHRLAPPAGIEPASET